MFAGRGLDELIPHIGRGFDGTTFNEFAAAYVRMLEIAFGCYLFIVGSRFVISLL